MNENWTYDLRNTLALKPAIESLLLPLSGNEDGWNRWLFFLEAGAHEVPGIYISLDVHHPKDNLPGWLGNTT